jgi:hypothetical protein
MTSAERVGFCAQCKRDLSLLDIWCDWWVLIKYSKSVVAINGNLSKDPRLAIYEVMR